MVLTELEYKRYLNVHLQLLYYCYCKKHELKNELSFNEFIRKPMDAKYEARNHFITNLFLLDEYLRENDNISNIDKEILNGFRKKLSGKYVILKQLKKYAILMDLESERFYAVYALSDPFESMLDGLPVLIETTLLPFEGKIIYDGFLIRQTYIGKNMELNMLNKYKEAKVNKLIIKTIG
jgi:hypothetical protein